ncbi:MAG: nitroreductase family protein [Rectinemataceae bacterium]
MNQVIEIIKSRRSLRSFKSDPVPKDLVQTILDAAIWAPSGMNAQAWRFTALVRRTLIDRLNALIRESLRSSSIERLRQQAARPDADFFYGAPVVIIASGESDSPTVAPDCAAGLENMLLAATSLGLGSCWVHAPTRLAASPETAALRAELGIPASHGIFGSMAVGYAAGALPPAPGRKAACTAIVE